MMPLQGVRSIMCRVAEDVTIMPSCTLYCAIPQVPWWLPYLCLIVTVLVSILFTRYINAFLPWGSWPIPTQSKLLPPLGPLSLHARYPPPQFSCWRLSLREQQGDDINLVQTVVCGGRYKHLFSWPSNETVSCFGYGLYYCIPSIVHLRRHPSQMDACNFVWLLTKMRTIVRFQ